MNNSKSYDETQYTKWNKNNDKKEILNKLLKYFKESNINDFGYEEDKLISYEEAQILLDCITNLQKERDKFKTRCYKSLKLIRDNYGLLDKYGIDILDDILTGGDSDE